MPKILLVRFFPDTV